MIIPSGRDAIPQKARPCPNQLGQATMIHQGSERLIKYIVLQADRIKQGKRKPLKLV
jgi:hypothetical protein